MRHFLILATVALSFLMSTSMASAFSTSMSRIDGGGDLNIGDTVEAEVSFHNQEEINDIKVIGVSVLFDSALFTYQPAVSLTPSYALYNGPAARGNVWLSALSTNMTIRAGTDYQILLDWSSTTTGVTGTRDACGNYGSYPAGPITGSACGFVMARLVFQAIAEGTAEFVLTSAADGNTLFVGDDIFTPNPTSGNFSVQVPEPAAASLSIFALLSLAGLRLRATRH